MGVGWDTDTIFNRLEEAGFPAQAKVGAAGRAGGAGSPGQRKFPGSPPSDLGAGRTCPARCSCLCPMTCACRACLDSYTHAPCRVCRDPPSWIQTDRTPLSRAVPCARSAVVPVPPSHSHLGSSRLRHVQCQAGDPHRRGHPRSPHPSRPRAPRILFPAVSIMNLHELIMSTRLQSMAESAEVNKCLYNEGRGERGAEEKGQSAAACSRSPGATRAKD